MHENHFQEQVHQEIDQIFCSLFPKYGMTIREEQLRLCHQMLSALWNGQIALCDAAVGVGKTYAYLTASLLFRKYSGMLNGNYCMSRDNRPIVISTSSIALQDALLRLFIFLHLSKRICYNVPEKTSLQDSSFLNLVNNMNRDYKKERGTILR